MSINSNITLNTKNWFIWYVLATGLLSVFTMLLTSIYFYIYTKLDPSKITYFDGYLFISISGLLAAAIMYFVYTLVVPKAAEKKDEEKTINLTNYFSNSSFLLLVACVSASSIFIMKAFYTYVLFA